MHLRAKMFLGMFCVFYVQRIFRQLTAKYRLDDHLNLAHAKRQKEVTNFYAKRPINIFNCSRLDDLYISNSKISLACITSY